MEERAKRKSITITTKETKHSHQGRVTAPLLPLPFLRHCHFSIPELPRCVHHNHSNDARLEM